MTVGIGRLVFGTDEPVAPALHLHAGRLTATLRGARLGPVRFDGHEVWHGVDFLYRDPDWGTPAAAIDSVDHVQHARGFRVSIRGRVLAAADIQFSIAIEAHEGELRYEARATPRGDVATNRTGIVLMHPLTACGRRIEVEHTDGRSSASTFPKLVAPWPPFMLVRAIRHEFAEGGWGRCRFEGDDFELEDQRNNADASFKTYSRSNLMTRPFTLRAGAGLRQCVELRIESTPAAPHVDAPRPVRVDVGAPGGVLPAIGTAITSADVHPSPHARDALRTLAPVLLHLCLDAPDESLDAPALARLVSDAGPCALRLDVAGLDAVRAGVQLAALAEALASCGVSPGCVAVFPSTPPLIEAARHAFAHARIGGGTPHFFTQLNRVEDLGRADFLTFTTASVVHGADDEEIMAGLASLPSMVETLRFRHGNVPLHVGPSSIGARRSPLGAQPDSDGTRRLALARCDPRTRGLYGAAWALGYAAQCSNAGVQALTLFGMQGAAGLLEGEATTPAFEVLRRLARPAGLHEVRVSDPDAVAVLGLDRGTRLEVLLANLGGEPVEVQLHGATPTRVQVMDADALRARADDPREGAWRDAALRSGTLQLQAYAVASVETPLA